MGGRLPAVLAVRGTQKDPPEQSWWVGGHDERKKGTEATAVRELGCSPAEEEPGVPQTAAN